jgi:hypothetical protein
LKRSIGETRIYDGEKPDFEVSIWRKAKGTDTKSPSERHGSGQVCGTERVIRLLREKPSHIEVKKGRGTNEETNNSVKSDFHFFLSCCSFGCCGVIKRF